MDISVLKGKRIVRVEGLECGKDEIEIACADGSLYKMYHYQDCCESVRLEDIVGDPSDLTGLVVDARQESREATEEERSDDSATWTFYIIQTERGCVTLRWLGESNGYYSESVDFVQVGNESL